VQVYPVAHQVRALSTEFELQQRDLKYVLYMFFFNVNVPM